MPRPSPAELNAKRQRELVASRFKVNPSMENLAKIKDKDPDRYTALGPVFHLQLGYYLADKATAQGEGVDVGGAE